MYSMVNSVCLAVMVLRNRETLNLTVFVFMLEIQDVFNGEKLIHILENHTVTLEALGFETCCGG